MVIVGIDPGTIHLGVCVIEDKGGRLKPLMIDVIHASESDSKAWRIRSIAFELRRRFEVLRPDRLVVEKSYVRKNPASAMAIAEAKGAAIASILHVKDIVEYQAVEARKIVLGKGDATKTEVKQMVERLLGLKTNLPLDATDAACLAIAGSVDAMVGVRV